MGSEATGKEGATYRAELQGAFGEDPLAGRLRLWCPVPNEITGEEDMMATLYTDAGFLFPNALSYRLSLLSLTSFLGIFLPVFSDTGSVEHTGRRLVPEVSSRDRREVHTL